MSEIEHHRGKLIPLNKYVSQFISDRLILEDIEAYGNGVNGYFENHFDGYNGNEHLLILNNLVYKVENINSDFGNLLLASKDKDGSYNYSVIFHNGSFVLEEAIVDAVNMLENI